VTAVVLRGDARRLPLPDACVDLIVTSPPYFGLRSYTDDGAHYDGQIGSEATPGEWLAALVGCTAEWVRVLKPSGSIFVNLGDKYSGGASGEQSGLLSHPSHTRGGMQPHSVKVKPVTGARPKSLLGLPWRYALACMDQLGLILRRDIIWCLSGGARLYARTKSGDRPIMLRDLIRAYRPEDIQLWNGQRWTQVLGWNRSPDRDGALELELRTGERIGCTPGHRWPTQRGVIRADEIRIGDVIQTTRLPEPDEAVTPAGLDDDDIGWLVGLYLAEGSRSEKTLQFAGHLREEARNSRLSRIAQAYHGNAAVYRTSENGITCNVNGAVLLGIVDHYIGRGRTALSKRLRKAVWQRSDRFLRALMDGYLEGDGHYDAKNDRWRLGFGGNDELAADLRTLAARLGAKISLRRSRGFLNGQSFPAWRGEWRWERRQHWNVKQDGEVVAIRASRAREFYDVGVADEPHVFALASGVLTHNSKPNGLPESVTDRCRSSHEYLFHMVRQPRYYAAVDEIREPHTADPKPRGLGSHRGRDDLGKGAGSGWTTFADDSIKPAFHNPLGKLPGSVWDIPSQPLIVPAALGVDHFASFPMELPRRCVLGWSPPGVCTACGEGRRPVSERVTGLRLDGRKRPARDNARNWSESACGDNKWGGDRTWDRGVGATITGYACACPEPDAPVRPALVVDPFGGTGCTALVAAAYGRTGVSVDLSGDYCRLARWRTADPAERARALLVPKPPPVPDGQASLFDLPA